MKSRTFHSCLKLLKWAQSMTCKTSEIFWLYSFYMLDQTKYLLSDPDEKEINAYEKEILLSKFSLMMFRNNKAYCIRQSTFFENYQLWDAVNNLSSKFRPINWKPKWCRWCLLVELSLFRVWYKQRRLEKCESYEVALIF